MVKQGTMLATFSFLMGGCATEQAPTRTVVLAAVSKASVAAQVPLTALPGGRPFPELEAAVGQVGPSFARALGYDDYEVSAVLPQSSRWRYVRDPRLRVVVRRETALGIALRGRAPVHRCVYLEPIVAQDRLGARDWGPLRVSEASQKTRRLDCEVLGTPLASR